MIKNIHGARTESKPEFGIRYSVFGKKTAVRIKAKTEAFFLSRRSRKQNPVSIVLKPVVFRSIFDILFSNLCLFAKYPACKTPIFSAALLTAVLLFHTPARAAEPPATSTAAAPATGPLSSSVDFFKKEGAHFSSMLENWQLTGMVTDSEGKTYNFAAVFMQSGTAMMNMRNGYASFQPAGGVFFHTAFAPASIRMAALKELTKHKLASPDDKQAIADFDALNKSEYPNFEVFPGTPDVYQTILFINYGKNHFERTSKTSFTYSLLLDVQGNQLALELKSASDPDIMDQDLSIPVGNQGAFFSAYCFPSLNISGTLIMADRKVRIVSGSARFFHFWGSLDQAAFSKYSIISQTLENGRSLYVFNFYGADGALRSSHIITTGPDGKIAKPADASAQETDYFISPVSNITYPLRWNVKADNVEGEISLPPKRSELDIIHGVGAFYLGPCSFIGVTGDKAPISGTGDCRLVSVEKKN